MIAWNDLYLKAGPLKPDPGKSAAWNRGAYLVEGLGHCGACHTPKTVLGGDEADRRLQGAALQGWFAPDLTGNVRTGLAGWSQKAIVRYLKTGHNGTAGAGGPMAEEVSLSSSRMSDADLGAIATYLKDLPGQASAAPTGVVTPASGAAIYADRCSGCHAGDGAGVSGLIPTLDGAPFVMSRDPTSTIRVILDGAKTASTAGAPTGPGMPAFGWVLTDAQVAAVATYVRNAWHNHSSEVSAGKVGALRHLSARGR